MSHYPIVGSNVLGFFKNSKPFRGGQVPVRVIPEAEAEGLCEPEMPEPEFQIELPGSVGRLRNVLDPWLSLLRKVGGVGTEGLEFFSSPWGSWHCCPNHVSFLCLCLMIITRNRSLEKVCADVRVVHVHELSSSFGTSPILDLKDVNLKKPES